MNKHHNLDYDGTTPKAIGDRYYAQDRIRDFWYCVDLIGKLGLDSIGGGVVSFLYGLTSGTVTHGTGDTLNITAAVGYQNFPVKIPTSFAAFPPTTTADTAVCRIDVPVQANLAVTGGQISDNCYANATLNGATVNYVKIKYKELDAAETRTKAKRGGSYVYHKSSSYEIRIEPVVADSTEIAIASFTGTSGGAFTIATITGNRIPLSTEFVRLDQLEGLVSPLHGVKAFTASTTWTCPYGVTKLLYSIIGSGGSGGGAGVGAVGTTGGGGAGGSGGGAGGGGEARFGVATVVPGTVYTITVGTAAAGAGAAFGGSPTDGNNGGSSSAFSITAAGGTKGLKGANAAGAAGTGGTGATASSSNSAAGGAGGDGAAGVAGTAPGAGAGWGSGGAGGGAGSAGGGLGFDGNAGTAAVTTTAGTGGRLVTPPAGAGGNGGNAGVGGTSVAGTNGVDGTAGTNGAGGGGGGGGSGAPQTSSGTGGSPGTGGNGGASTGLVFFIF